MCSVFGRLHEPTSDIIQRLPRPCSMSENSLKVFLVRSRLPRRSQIGRVATEVRLSTLIREIDLRLIEWCVEQIVTEQLHAGPGWRTDAQPIHSQRVAARDPILRIERQKLRQRLFLSTVDQVALKLGDDE